MPVKTLKKVVLPAPFGPMMEAMCPSSSWKFTSLRAVRPPKRLVIARASRSGATSAVLELAHAALGGQDALRAEDHHEDEDEAEDHALVLGGLELGRQVGQVEPEDAHAGIAQLVQPEGEPLQHLQVQHGDHGGAENGAWDRAHAAEDDHGEHADRFHEREGLRVDEDLLGREEHADGPREG